jgi:hypothetical protein
MVRPDRTAKCFESGGSCYIELSGASPVAVSAEAPRSRPRAREEIPPSEWGVESPAAVVRLPGGKQVRRPSAERTLQPREIRTRKVGQAEPLMSRRRQQTAPVLLIGAVQDARGVKRRACGDSSMRNRRDPSRLPVSGEGDPYKPMVKADRAGRESEGFIVPLTPVSKGRSREGTLLWSRRCREVSVRAWSQDPTTPLKKRENSSIVCTWWPSASGSVVCARGEASGVTSGGERGSRNFNLEARMPPVKIIGKPYAGNPHVRFDRGSQETERARHRA